MVRAGGFLHWGVPHGVAPSPADWTPDSWRACRAAAGLGPIPEYDDAGALSAAVERIAALPPLVTSGEIERLRQRLAEAAEGRAFVLWGGDCAETFSDCTSGAIAARLKMLLQMALVLRAAGDVPVVRIGRIAGQYAKPRSSPVETRVVGGREATLPSYFGDLINRSEFTAAARRPDPALMLEGYRCAGLTLNFIRALLDAGFADLHHPENWDLGFLSRAALLPEQREAYRRLAERVSVHPPADPAAEEFYTSHEALNLWYESAQTRRVPRRDGWFNLTCHLPWIGQRTGDEAGPHVEYARGVHNPIGLKIGPEMTGQRLARLVRILDPHDEPGRLVLLPRLGVARVRPVLDDLVRSLSAIGRRGLWVVDPMHGNSVVTSRGVKTRSFDDVLAEIHAADEVLRAHGRRLAGVHVELTPLDVTECVGGAAGIGEDDLPRNYTSPCDPRLNYEQAMELAFAVAGLLQGRGASVSAGSR